MNGDEPGLSDRAKYLGNPNYVTEFVGPTKLDLIITFDDPSNMFDTSRFASAKIGTAICATVARQRTPFNATRMVHMIRETEDGVEMRSRFWMGTMSFRFSRPNSLLNRLLRSVFPVRKIIPDPVGAVMLTHCAEEMNHLASFLPALYRAYHPQAAA